jgi:hypothetical protein
MGMRTTDDLVRTMQRLALVERRLERLEALVRDQSHPRAVPPSDAAPGGKSEKSNPRGTPRELRFPEIRLQLAETAAPARAKEPSVSNARAAIEAYPHLLQPLCTLWGHPEFDRYVNRLLVDERGGRKGFSAEVVEELLFLAQLNHHFCPTWLPRDPWADSQFMGDRM